MKKFGVWLILSLLSLASVSAQVSVEIVLDQNNFLPGEDINLATRIVNHSGQTLHLGSEVDWLTFTVESRDGAVVAQISEVPVKGAFELESSKMATKRVNLAPCFSFPRPGRYLITAVVKIKSWDREISSPAKPITIIEGAKLWQQDFGLPAATNSNAQPEIRKYVLQQATYLRGPLRLYLRITDATGVKTFKVVPVGPMVSFGRPDPQVDPTNNLHLLYQNGPYSFSYTVYSPEGELLKRQAYDIDESKPRLRLNEQGELAIVGGLRRESPNDIPPPKPESEEEAGAAQGTNTTSQAVPAAGSTNQVGKAPAPTNQVQKAAQPK